jgi:hypothetical protein
MTSVKWFARSWWYHWRDLFAECRLRPWYDQSRALGIVVMLTIMPMMLAIIAWRERDYEDEARPL